MPELKRCFQAMCSRFPSVPTSKKAGRWFCRYAKFCSLFQKLAEGDVLLLPLPFSVLDTVNLVLGCFTSCSLLRGLQLAKLGCLACRSTVLDFQLLALRNLLRHVCGLFTSLVRTKSSIVLQRQEALVHLLWGAIGMAPTMKLS